MDTIELSFVCEDSFGSKLIKWFTHSDFSHVDVIIEGMRVGARMDHPVQGKTGVQIRPMNYGQFTVDQRVIVPAPFKQVADCWLWDQVGKPYDSEGLIRSFLFNAGRSVPWWDENQWWCSELAAVYVAKATGIRCDVPASRVAPNDAYLFAGTLRDALARS